MSLAEGPELPASLAGADALREVEVGMALVEDRLRAETASDDPTLQEMARHAVLSGGKRLRPRLTLLAATACGGSALDEAVDVATAVELVHAASLVHDDIIDDADLRRGTWSLHQRHGPGPSIVAGDFLFTRGFRLAGRLDARVVEVLADACTRLAEGEVHEQRAEGEDLSLARYLRIIRDKTAEPIRGAARAGAAVAGASPEVVDALGDYGLRVGVAFQIRDDLLDLQGDVGETGKPPGTDLDQGVTTLPAILHAARDGTMPRWRSLRRIRSALEETGSMARSQAVAEAYARAARHALEPVPDSPARRTLEQVAHEAVERTR